MSKTYTSKEDLRGCTLQYGDKVQFPLTNRIVTAEVDPHRLFFSSCNDDDQFLEYFGGKQRLQTLAMIATGKRVDLDNYDLPKFETGDYRAITQFVRTLYLEIEKKERNLKPFFSETDITPADANSLVDGSCAVNSLVTDEAPQQTNPFIKRLINEQITMSDKRSSGDWPLGSFQVGDIVQLYYREGSRSTEGPEEILKIERGDVVDVLSTKYHPGWGFGPGDPGGYIELIKKANNKKSMEITKRELTEGQKEGLKADDRALMEAGFIDNTLMPTREGLDALNQVLFKANKKDVVAVAKKRLAEAEEKEKES